MAWRTWASVCLASLVELSACSSNGTSAADGGSSSAAVQVFASQKARLSAASVPAADVLAAAQANNQFGLTAYQALKDLQPSGNALFSPYSAEVALAMTAQGAKGETLAQMQQTLAFSLPAAQMHPAFGALDLALMSRGSGAAGKDGQPFRLKIANSTWGQKGFPFVEAFLDGLKVNYGAGMNAVDFEQDAEAARLAINSWVLAATEKKIKDLIPKGAVDNLTRLVLVNAIYFNAAWEKPFNPQATLPGPFTTPAGKSVSVPRMVQTAMFGYASSADWQALELRYDGGEIAMLIVLPGAGKLVAVENTLSAAQLKAIVAQLTPSNIRVTLPKWQLDWSAPLVKVLQGLGMTAAFSPTQADLSGIGGSKGELFITAVLQKTFIGVDERGTEAAAATAVIVGTTSAPPPPIDFTADRPFIYVIRDVATEAVLFVGRVGDPSVGI